MPILCRRGHTVLQRALPAKSEHVFLIKMSPLQRGLYNKFMSSVEETRDGVFATMNALKAFAVCCKVSNLINLIMFACQSKSPVENRSICGKGLSDC